MRTVHMKRDPEKRPIYVWKTYIGQKRPRKYTCIRQKRPRKETYVCQETLYTSKKTKQIHLYIYNRPHMEYMYV